MTEVSSIMAKICNINFWIENAPLPPPSKIHPVLDEVGFPYTLAVQETAGVRWQEAETTGGVPGDF